LIIRSPTPGPPGSRSTRSSPTNGVSGVATRLVERTEGRRLFDKLRSGDTLVVRWVDRLGRNYEGVCDTIREFMRRGVVIRTVINNFTFDGADRFAAYVEELTRVIGHADRAAPLRDYCAGLLTAEGRWRR
jgi:Resolvase, N terminal domain